MSYRSSLWKIQYKTELFPLLSEKGGDFGLANKVMRMTFLFLVYGLAREVLVKGRAQYS